MQEIIGPLSTVKSRLQDLEIDNYSFYFTSGFVLIFRYHAVCMELEKKLL